MLQRRARSKTGLKSHRRLFVVLFVAAAYIVELFFLVARYGAARSVIPVTEPGSRTLAAGVLGATIMPHDGIPHLVINTASARRNAQQRQYQQRNGMSRLL